MSDSERRCYPDFLKTVLEYRFSQLLFGSNAKSTKQYQQEVVPDLLTQIHDRLPDLYESLITEYPEYKQGEHNYIGRAAYISSMKEGSVLKTKDGEEYILHNGKLTGVYRSGFLPFGSRQAEISMEVTEEMTYQITDNNQVDFHTKFV